MKISCPNCSKILGLADKHIGKRVKCPNCESIVQVPDRAVNSLQAQVVPISPAEKIQLTCSCGAQLKAPANLIGKKVACPKCKNHMLVQVDNVAIAYPLGTVPIPADSLPTPQATNPFSDLGDISTRASTQSQAYDPFAGLGSTPSAASGEPSNNYWSTPVSSTTPAAGALPAGSWDGGLSAAEKQASASIALENASTTNQEAVEGGFRGKVMIFMGLLVIAGPIFTWSGCRDQQQLQLLATDGQTVAGEIMEAELRRGRKGRRSYKFDVEFKTHTGQVIYKQFSVGSTLFNKHCNDEEIYNPAVDVRYAKSDPNISMIAGSEGNPSLSIFGGIFAVVFGGLALAGILYFDLRF
jgi:DNA-directed RNA polymerase subunit M/transcription elongation factor TFIIS